MAFHIFAPKIWAKQKMKENRFQTDFGSNSAEHANLCLRDISDVPHFFHKERKKKLST